MRGFLKDTINALLQPAGFELRRRQDIRVDPKYYVALIDEVAACFRLMKLADLPPNARRTAFMARLTGTQPCEALYLLESLNRSRDVSGDVCEFGTGCGSTSALLANEILESDRNLWLFDSFQGLPKPTDKDTLLDDIHNLGSIEKYEGRMAFSLKEVRRRVEETGIPMSRVKVVPGFIEKTINQPGLPSKVAFAYVDFDFYEPIRLALDYLHRCMPAGGHIVVDDYGCFSQGAQTAVDEFLDQYPGVYEKTMPLDFAGHFVMLQKRK